MIGDLILFISEKFKQTFCKHDYEYLSSGLRIFGESFEGRRCKKCDREKWRR